MLDFGHFLFSLSAKIGAPLREDAKCLKLLRTLRVRSLLMYPWKYRYTQLLFAFTGWVLGWSVQAQSPAFIENKGQWQDEVVYRYTLNNGDLWLEKTGWTMTVLDEAELGEAMHALHGEDGSTLVHGHVLKATFAQANAAPVIRGNAKRTEYHNYFIGQDPSRWQGRVPLYDSVTYLGLYRGIDLVVENTGEGPKMTYIVAPGADPGQIEVHYHGNRGLHVTGDRLIIKTSVGDVVEQGLQAYQWMNGKRVPVESSFVTTGAGSVSFSLGGYNPVYPLYIDPVVVASTNSGSTAKAFGHTATFDHLGNIYSSGRCYGTGYPTDTGSFQADFAGPFNTSVTAVDICISKYNPDGSALLYATYLGGNQEDLPHSMIVNSAGHLHVLGSTNSTNYPVSALAFDLTYNGSKDIVLSSFSEDGSALIASTYVGGTGNDGVNAIQQFYADNYRGEVILDSLDNVYVASFSNSGDFPVTGGAFQTTSAGLQEGVVFKMPPDLGQMTWATYLGGGQNDAAFGLKLNDSLHVYVAGVTSSSNFPSDSAGAYSTYQGGLTDAFVCRLSADGSTLQHASFFGTPAKDYNYLVELDHEGSVYLFGITLGTVTATTGKYVGPGVGGFIYKTTPSLDAVSWISTFGTLSPAAFLVDQCKRIYVSGQGATTSVLQLPSFDTIAAVNGLGQAGFYLMKLSPEAETLEFGTFYGHNASHVDGGTSRFDKRGVIYQATCSNGVFPTTPWAYSTNNNGGDYDNTVFKIDFEANAAYAEILPGDTVCAPMEVQFSNSGSTGTVHYWYFGDGASSTDSMPIHTYDSVGTYEIFYVISDSQGCYGHDSAFLELTVVEPVLPQITVGDTHCVDSVLLSVDPSFASFLWNTGDTTATIYAHSSGPYIVQCTSEFYCEHADTQAVHIHKQYHLELSDTGICELGFSVMGPPSAAFYLWSTGDTTQSVVIDTTGSYILTAGDGQCQDTDTMQVYLSYISFSTTDTAVCDDSLILGVQHAGGTILWNTGKTTPAITVHHSGTYWAVVQNGFCSSRDTIEVVFNPPLLDLPADTVICQPTVFDIYDPSFLSYYWNTGDTGSAVTLSGTGQRWVAVSDGNCTDTAWIRVKQEHIAFASPNAYACDQDSFELFAPGPEGSAFLWSTGATTRNLMVYQPGPYSVAIQSTHCKFIDTVQVAFIQPPVFSIGDDRIMCVGETLDIAADTLWGPVYWNTGDTGSHIRVLDGGLIIANMDYHGCIGSDSVEVSLRDLNSGVFDLVPNIITPNNDGLNDEFQLKMSDNTVVTSYHIVIYDRWGIEVFESDDINDHWKGTFPSGKPAYEGTYFYMVECETVCTQRSRIEWKDNVTLLRQ